MFNWAFRFVFHFQFKAVWKRKSEKKYKLPVNIFFPFADDAFNFETAAEYLSNYVFYPEFCKNCYCPNSGHNIAIDRTLGKSRKW